MERGNRMYFEELTSEQKQRARACKNADELFELAKAEGVELSDEQLESVSGGSWIQCEEIACPEDDGAPECDRYC